MLLPSIPISYLYAYNSNFYGYTLDATVVIAITYFGTTLSAIVLPWRRRDIYKASPIAKYELAGIPLVTISGRHLRGVPGLLRVQVVLRTTPTGQPQQLAQVHGRPLR